jgi:DNA-binding transcriptional LysR family regulator
VLGVHAVYPPSRHVTAKLRAFVDFLIARFSPRPQWLLPAG